MLASEVAKALAAAAIAGAPADEEGLAEPAHLLLSWPLVLSSVVFAGISNVGSPVNAMCSDYCAHPSLRPRMYTFTAALSVTLESRRWRKRFPWRAGLRNRH